jgi:hypothetical protein
MNITLPLSELVSLALGEDPPDISGNPQLHQRTWFARPIKPLLAEIIIGLTGNKSHCYIQFADELSPHLKQPLLWDLASWQTHHDIWSREKIASDNRRKERFIFEANVKILSKCIGLSTGMDLEYCLRSAENLLRNKKKAGMNVFLSEHNKKLITKAEDI